MKNTKFVNFREVIRYNFGALEDLASIRLSLDEKLEHSPDEYFFRSATQVERMIEGYSVIADLGEEEQEKLKTKLKEIKQTGKRPVETLTFSKKFGYQGTSIMSDNSKSMFYSVENISRPLRNPTNPDFNLENVKTLHDMIRYVHQKSIDAMFEVKQGEGEKRIQTLSKTTFEIVDTDGESQNNQTLQELISEYERISSFKPGYETVRVLSADNYINAHLRLGCHSADLSALLDGHASFIDLKYKESGCAGSAQRQEYISRCLTEEGFKVEITKGILEAKLRDRGTDTIRSAIKKVTRLLASSKDLDIMGTLPLDYMVDFFRAGGVNTKRAVKIKKSIDKTITEKRTQEEALAYLEHRIKKDLQKVIPEAKEFVLNYAVQQYESEYGESTVRELLETEEFITEKPEGFVGTMFGSIDNAGFLLSLDGYKNLSKESKFKNQFNPINDYEPVYQNGPFFIGDSIGLQPSDYLQSPKISKSLSPITPSPDLAKPFSLNYSILEKSPENFFNKKIDKVFDKNPMIVPKEVYTDFLNNFITKPLKDKPFDK